MRVSRNAAFLLGGIALALLLALFLSPYASPYPDGLEKVAEVHGFLSRGENGAFPYAPFPDYVLTGVESPIWATGMAGLLGTLVVTGLALLLGLGLRQAAGGEERRR